MAEQAQIDLLSITDHDTIEGFLQIADRASSVRVVSGVELSSCWSNGGIHIIGLGFDPTHPVLTQALQMQRRIRQQRAEIISENLRKQGMSGAYEGALKHCDGQANKLGRPHFAAFLVEKGYAKSQKMAFKRWLGQGKCGDVRKLWPDMQEVVAWIRQAGGVPVLAHPLKYKMTNTKLKRLVGEFKLAGGQAIEVISAGQTADNSRYLQQICETFELHASGGSDFHHPGMQWCQLGRIAPLPKASSAVWELLSV